MNSMIEALTLEHQLRVKKADLIGPHLFEHELRTRRNGDRLAIRERIGSMLVAVGIWLQGTSAITPVPAQG